MKTEKAREDAGLGGITGVSDAPYAVDHCHTHRARRVLGLIDVPNLGPDELGVGTSSRWLAGRSGFQKRGSEAGAEGRRPGRRETTGAAESKTRSKEREECEEWEEEAKERSSVS